MRIESETGFNESAQHLIREMRAMARDDKLQAETALLPHWREKFTQERRRHLRIALWWRRHLRGSNGEET